MNVPPKYGVVRTIAFILKLLAWVALAAGLLTAIVALVGASNNADAAGGLFRIIRSIGLILGPLVGIVWFVQLYAFGSILSLLVDVEENTRQLALQQPSYVVQSER
jgi:hypothetical protein